MNKYTLSYWFLYGNVHGLVFAKNRPVSLNWSDYTRHVLQPFGSGIIPVGMSDEFATDQIPCLIEQHFTNMRRCIHEPSMHVTLIIVALYKKAYLRVAPDQQTFLW